MQKKKAVILLSGGLDSSTVLAIAKDMGYDLYAITISYGQRHLKEVESAKKVAAAISVNEHKFINVNLSDIGGSALTDIDIDMPLDTLIEDIGAKGRIPASYVPARNLILLSIALSYAEVILADAIFIGVNAVDYSGYPDCRPEFIETFKKTAKLATAKKWDVEIIAPLSGMTKVEIIQKGLSLGVDYSLTWSCYLGGEVPCGRCESCILRENAFNQIFTSKNDKI